MSGAESQLTAETCTNGGFPQLGVPFWGSTIRIIVFQRLCWVTPILGNYQIAWGLMPSTVDGQQLRALSASSWFLGENDPRDEFPEPKESCARNLMPLRALLPLNPHHCQVNFCSSPSQLSPPASLFRLASLALPIHAQCTKESAAMLRHIVKRSHYPDPLKDPKNGTPLI